jgi:hypothetical protein
MDITSLNFRIRNRRRTSSRSLKSFPCLRSLRNARDRQAGAPVSPWSQEAETRRAGAQLASLAALLCSEAQDLLREALQGDVHQRVGVATVAAANISSNEHREICQAHLEQLFWDSDSAVREATSECFRTLEPPILEEFADLIEKFCDSPAFDEGSSALLHVLEESSHRLPGIVCRVCERFLSRFGDEARDMRTARAADGYAVSKLIFRAYHQHQSDKWAGRALDLIDQLCQKRVGDIGKELEQFDR